jgi:chromosomal replication initiator protein
VNTDNHKQNQLFWSHIKSALKQKNSANKPLQMWFEPTELMSVIDKGSSRCFQIGVPTELHKYWISQNLLDRICSEISSIYESSFEVELIVTQSESEYGSPPIPDQNSPEMIIQPPTQTTDQGPGLSTHMVTQHSMADTKKVNNYAGLNSNYVFSSFVVGRNNEFAHAASFSISESPGLASYNPLFICGPTGMGKTHLLNAVGNHIIEKDPNLKVLYLSAERFLNECVSSIRRQEMDKFRIKYRTKCDVLLMDDIQVLGRGEAVQEEFFHTLNDFFDKGQQVVVASDRMPKDINGLEDRIRTRLEWGLIADIQMPELETRMAILKYKAEQKQMNLSSEVVNYIARISKRSIRELEGNLNKVKMFSELQGFNITIDLVKKVLAVHGETETISLEEIQQITAKHFGVRMVDLKSKNRSKPLVIARQVSMYLIKKHLDKSLVDIGRSFGGRDHTTVINALRKIEAKQSSDLELKRDIDELTTRIHNVTGV